MIQRKKKNYTSEISVLIQKHIHKSLQKTLEKLVALKLVGNYTIQRLWWFYFQGFQNLKITPPLSQAHVQSTF